MQKVPAAQPCPPPCLLAPVSLFTRPCSQAFMSIDTRAVMADEDNEFERPRKIPKTLKEKDSGKRLIVILEKASLETVKVLIQIEKVVKLR